MLEAGPIPGIALNMPGAPRTTTPSPLDWNYRSQVEQRNCAGRGCSWEAGRALGGTTNIGDMMYNRGQRQDFDRWSALGNN